MTEPKIPTREELENDYFDDLHFDREEYCETCGNTGTLDCECGGDICVCMNNGEIPCPDCSL